MEKQKQSILFRLSNIIKLRRKQLNLSQEALANKCNLDRSYIGSLERSKRNPTLVTLILLSKGLEIELSELLSQLQYES